MNNCIFCQIVAGSSPAFKIYEDDLFLGFLDIYPGTRGHTLVIPKKHYQWVYDVPEFDKYWLVVLKITKAIQKALKPIFITYLTYGLHVPHAHIHILPRSEKDKNELAPMQGSIDKKEMREIADIINKEIISGHRVNRSG